MKKLTTYLKRTPAATFLAGLVLFLAFVFALLSLFQNMTQSGSLLPSADSAPLSLSKKTNIGLPVRLNIPAIHVVNAAIEYVGLTPQGAMDVPKGPSNAAWYKLGPRPGEEGSAVIAGHEGWKEGTPAIFDNLHTLRKGDRVTIENAVGSTTTFVVREIRTYGENENPPGVFDSKDGKAHLNLITCEGVWNAASKSYAGRLVVFTDKVAE